MSRAHLHVRLLTLALAMIAGHVARADQPSNIILCVADDQGSGDTGYAGHQFLKIPHLDRLLQNAEVQLFDLNKDPGERRDVSNLYPDRADRILGELRD